MTPRSVAVGDGVEETEGAIDGVMEEEGDDIGVALSVSVVVGVPEGVRVEVPEAEPVAELVGEGDVVPELDCVDVVLGVCEQLGVPEGDNPKEVEEDGVRDDDAVGLRLKDRVVDGVSVAVPVEEDVPLGVPVDVAVPLRVPVLERVAVTEDEGVGVSVGLAELEGVGVGDVHTPLPGSLVELPAHAVQPALPLVEYVFAGHSAQTMLPRPAANVPGAQAVHEAEPTSVANEPGKHA